MLDDLPIRYDEPLFRPPSEANALILQVTLGCSWNRCSFCEMYTTKRFRPRPADDIENELRAFASRYRGVRKVFFADGNAMVLSAARLLRLLDLVRAYIPEVEQISCYAMPADINRKSPAELKQLRDAGLSMVYVGVESGDDDILRRVEKGQTQSDSIAALNRAGEAGIKRSVMILNGLGGANFSRQHAEGTAAVLNATQPEFASTLVVTFPLGEDRFRTAFGEGYEPPSQQHLFAEMYMLLDACELRATEFRSNHASNYLTLRGRLNDDKPRLLQQISQAIATPEAAGLRPEWARGL